MSLEKRPHLLGRGYGSVDGANAGRSIEALLFVLGGLSAGPGVSAVGQRPKFKFRSLGASRVIDTRGLAYRAIEREGWYSH